MTRDMRAMAATTALFMGACAFISLCVAVFAGSLIAAGLVPMFSVACVLVARETR